MQRSSRAWDIRRSLEIADRAMTAETTHDNLASALVAALAELNIVEANRTAKIKSPKGDYSYNYADIGDVVKLTRPALARHGVIALTPVHAHGDGLACTVILLHTSNDKLELGPFPFPHGANAQATGSMVTYHRRYALVAALGMAAGDDDDGQHAAPRSRSSEQQSSSSDERICDRCKEPIGTEPVKVLGRGVYAHKDCVEPKDGSEDKADNDGTVGTAASEPQSTAKQEAMV